MPLRTGPETLVALAITVASAAVSAGLGRRIGTGDVWLISGYRPSSAGDEMGLARLVARVCYALALASAAYGLAMLVVEPRALFWLIYIALFAVAVVVVQVRGRRYA